MDHVLNELRQSAAMHESNARVCERYKDDSGLRAAMSRASEYRAAIAVLELYEDGRLVRTAEGKPE